MLEWFFYDLAEGYLIAILLVALLAGTELGFRLGYRDRDRFADPAKSQIGAIQAALLGLLGLLLGFTYSMASSRYDARKLLVVEEVNAVGTTLLRAQLLPKETRATTERLIQEYVDARIESSRAVDPLRDPSDARAGRLQKQLWSVAMADAEATGRASISALYVVALNNMLDSKTRRDAALLDHVPVSVLALVFMASLIVFGVVGYGFGLAGSRGLLVTTFLAVLVALVFLVVLDLDRPRRGLVRVGQQGMSRLIEEMRTSSK